MKNPVTPTAAFEIFLIVVVENGGFWIELIQKPPFGTAAIDSLSFRVAEYFWLFPLIFYYCFF